jgi:cyanophycinase-like exopeptidase
VSERERFGRLAAAIGEQIEAGVIGLGVDLQQAEHGVKQVVVAQRPLMLVP